MISEEYAVGAKPEVRSMIAKPGVRYIPPPHYGLGGLRGRKGEAKALARLAGKLSGQLCRPPPRCRSTIHAWNAKIQRKLRARTPVAESSFASSDEKTQRRPRQAAQVRLAGSPGRSARDAAPGAAAAAATAR
jgi:hypothetical protein